MSCLPLSRNSFDVMCTLSFNRGRLPAEIAGKSTAFFAPSRSTSRRHYAELETAFASRSRTPRARPDLSALPIAERMPHGAPAFNTKRSAQPFGERLGMMDASAGAISARYFGL